MIKSIRVFALLSAVVMATGCASIMSGQTQQISVNSNVEGATVIINGIEAGKTPFVGEIRKPKAGSGNTITLRKDGYKDATIAVGTEIEPTFWVNLLSGGPFGSTTDYAGGAMYKLGDGAFQVPMEKK